MSETILILGGTKEAADLAAELVREHPDWRIVTSLAGRTREPKPLAGEVRQAGDIGGCHREQVGSPLTTAAGGQLGGTQGSQDAGEGRRELPADAIHRPIGRGQDEHPLGDQVPAHLHHRNAG